MSARLAMLSAMLPSPEQTWLLRACLLDGGDGREAWRTWRDLAGDPKAAMAEDRWSVKRLLPALYAALRRNGAVVDATLLPYLKLAYVREQIRSRTYLGICHEILTTLAQAGVPFVVLRGAALATTAYPDPAIRHCHDISLLVHESDVPQATEVLQRNGLQPVHVAASAGVIVGAAAVLRHATTLPVELHARLFGIPLYDVPTSAVWPRTRQMSVAGARALVLAPADALLHVCGHAAYSPGRESLRWVCDAWYLIAANPALDWELLLESARRGRLTLPLAVTLRYLSAQLGATIPESVLERLQEDARRVPAIERDVALRGARVGACENLGVMLRRVPGSWRIRTQVVAWLLWPSREYVRDVVGVRGPTAALLHYVRRPLDYARRYLRRTSYAA